MNEQKAVAGYMVYRGQCFSPVSFHLLPRLKFKPGEPMGLTEKQLQLALKIEALHECDEAGTLLAELPVAEAVPEVAPSEPLVVEIARKKMTVPSEPDPDNRENGQADK